MDLGNKGTILFLTRYDRLGASSRYRFFQYIPYFESNGISCTVSPLFDDDYLRKLYETGRGGLAPLIKAFNKRIKTLLGAKKYDLIVIEKEILPFFPPIFEKMFARMGVPYIVDYDDAIFHQYDQHHNVLFRTLFRDKIATVMRCAALVIAGNNYLADYARNVGAKWVEILPTVIDLTKYPQKKTWDSTSFTVGWIGSPSSSAYLRLANRALNIFCSRREARVLLVGSGRMELTGVPMEVHQWSEESEIQEILQFDVGIMPLPDNGWARGKCGFKIIQYMACGIPVVASPVGENVKIVEHAVNGFLPVSTDDWVTALDDLFLHPHKIHQMGIAGRTRVEKNYCLKVTAPQFHRFLETALQR
jgi:glycosyltransferase involved in cell wall biosynthesis